MTVFPGLLSEDFLPIVLIFLLFLAIVKQQNRLWGFKIKIPLQKVAFKLDISASSGGNPKSAG